MDREVSPAAETRIRIIKNVVRGWNAYNSGRPGLALIFLQRAMRDLQTLIVRIEKQEEERHDST